MRLIGSFCLENVDPRLDIIVSGFRGFSATQYEHFMTVISVFEASKSLDGFLALIGARLYSDDSIDCGVETGWHFGTYKT
jgi:hypothetical protein